MCLNVKINLAITLIIRHMADEFFGEKSMISFERRTTIDIDGHLIEHATLFPDMTETSLPQSYDLLVVFAKAAMILYCIDFICLRSRQTVVVDFPTINKIFAIIGEKVTAVTYFWLMDMFFVNRRKRDFFFMFSSSWLNSINENNQDKSDTRETIPMRSPNLQVVCQLSWTRQCLLLEMAGLGLPIRSGQLYVLEKGEILFRFSIKKSLRILFLKTRVSDKDIDWIDITNLIAFLDHDERDIKNFKLNSMFVLRQRWSLSRRPDNMEGCT